MTPHGPTVRAIPSPSRLTLGRRPRAGAEDGVALQWTSTLSVGDEAIDAQHRELFVRLDRLHDAMLRRERAEALRLLAFLRDYSVVHFEAEERLMAEAAYPEAGRHAQEHEAFRASLRGLQEHFEAEGLTAGLVLDLERRVVGWLREHVYHSDVGLGRWIRRARGGAATP
jgi:hemerythrin